MQKDPQAPARYDVAVIGGALSGASAALLLLREWPELWVLIIEKSPKFSRRVGEATVELSTYFLGRVLGLTQYLNEAHLVKQGLRFWFTNDRAQNLEQCSEIGGRRARGQFGRRNHGQRFLFKGYTFAGSSAAPIVQAILGWARLEMTEGWRSWRRAFAKEKPVFSATPSHVSQ